MPYGERKDDPPVEPSTTSQVPAWILTPREEKQVFFNWRNSAWKACDEYVSAFSQCEQTAGVGVWFKCKKQSKAMRDCIDHRRQKQYVDAERDLYIKKKLAARGISTKEDEEKELHRETVAAAAAAEAPQK